MSREYTFSSDRSQARFKPTYLEVVHRYFAIVSNLPFGHIPLFLSKSIGHVIDESPVQGLWIVHSDYNK